MDDLPEDVACALQMCADLERAAAVLQASSRCQQDAYVAQRAEDITCHVVAARRLLQALQSHVGWPSQPRRVTPRVLSPLPPVDTEAPTAILQPQPRTR